jgi:hypothetical protein
MGYEENEILQIRKVLQKNVIRDFAQRPANSRRWPGAVSKSQFNTRKGSFQVISWEPGQCPQARQTEPSNTGGLERAGRRRILRDAPEGYLLLGEEIWHVFQFYKVLKMAIKMLAEQSKRRYQYLV